VALKTWKVSCFDLRGVEHAIEVSAGSVYEAVAQALRIFHDMIWIEDIGHGQTPISINVKASGDRAYGPRARLRALSGSEPRSPAEMILKNRLRELLREGQLILPAQILCFA
jgi:hypothetical protein